MTTQSFAVSPRRDYPLEYPASLPLGSFGQDPAALGLIVNEYERHTAGSIAQAAKTAHCFRQIVELHQYGLLCFTDAFAFMTMVDETAYVRGSCADLYHAAVRQQLMLLTDQVLSTMRVAGYKFGEIMAMSVFPRPVLRRRGILYRLIFGKEEDHR